MPAIAPRVIPAIAPGLIEDASLDCCGAPKALKAFCVSEGVLRTEGIKDGVPVRVVRRDGAFELGAPELGAGVGLADAV